MSSREGQSTARAQFAWKYAAVGIEGIITRCEWSSNGALLAVPTQTGRFYVIQHETNTVLHSEQASHKALWACAWTKDSSRLAVGGRDNSVHIYDLVRGLKMFDLAGRSGPEEDEGHRDDVHSVHWSPNEQYLLTGSFDGTMRLWQANSGALTRTIRAHDGRIEDCYWDAQRDQLVSAARDGTIRSWDPHNGKLILDISAHDGFVLRLCAARKSRILYSASSDGSVRVWDRDDLRLIHMFKGFTGTPHDLSLSHDEKLLAVKDDNTSVRVYRTDTYELVDCLIEKADHHNWYSRAIFHPYLNELAATGERDRQLDFWTYDSDVLSRAASETSARTYANCRVGVLGTTGVGKTSLTNALIGEPFKPTDSTHATKVALLARTSSNESDSESWVREIFMWDFAGQPAYRLLQRFDVEGLAVALLVLDSRNTTDPIEEIAEWETLLRLASRSSAPSPPRIVVIARSDRGALSTTLSVDVWRKHIQNFVSTMETSAKEDHNIDKLRTAIISSIDWNHLPTITSDAQFQRLRMYVCTSASFSRRGGREGPYFAGKVCGSLRPSPS